MRGIAGGAQSVALDGAGIAGGEVLHYGSELSGCEFTVAVGDENFNIRMNDRLRFETGSVAPQW